MQQQLPQQYDEYCNKEPTKQTLNLHDDAWVISPNGETPVRKRKAVAFVDEKFVSSCMLCNVKFSIIVRKHHCRNCGKVFCGKCSKSRVLRKDDLILVRRRLCEACYTDSNEFEDYDTTIMTTPDITNGSIRIDPSNENEVTPSFKMALPDTNKTMSLSKELCKSTNRNQVLPNDDLENCTPICLNDVLNCKRRILEGEFDYLSTIWWGVSPTRTHEVTPQRNTVSITKRRKTPTQVLCISVKSDLDNKLEDYSSTQYAQSGILNDTQDKPNNMGKALFIALASFVVGLIMGILLVYIWYWSILRTPPNPDYISMAASTASGNISLRSIANDTSNFSSSNRIGLVRESEPSDYPRLNQGYPRVNASQPASLYIDSINSDQDVKVPILFRIVMHPTGGGLPQIPKQLRRVNSALTRKLRNSLKHIYKKAD